ncbi:glycosyltransferase [Rhodobacteraceae bacterium XHP0102]|nr:glycosyltransferase [Rhodobacteraceae bacterium XHP0102]
MRSRLDVAAVIAQRNDHQPLARLLQQMRAGGWFSQIIVVDDASHHASCDPAADFTLRLQKRAGAGMARNLGLGMVRAQYVMFLDADDTLLPSLSNLLDDLARGPDFDLCFFRHADSRLTPFGRIGDAPFERDIWAGAGCAIGALRQLPTKERTGLVRLSAYPWGRISRTAFLRDHGVRFAPTLVHNDIPFHWLGLMRADRVLTSDQIAIHHRLGPGRLTARRGASRAELFTGLDLVARALRDASPSWVAAFVQACDDVITWAETTRAARGAYWQAEKTRFFRVHHDIFAKSVVLE